MFLAGFLLALFTVWKVADLWRRAPIMRGCGIWAGDAREAEGWGGGGGKRKEALKGLVPSGGQGHSLERLFLHSMHGPDGSVLHVGPVTDPRSMINRYFKKDLYGSSSYCLVGTVRSACLSTCFLRCEGCTLSISRCCTIYHKGSYGV